MTAPMDDTDRRLIEETQAGLPLCERPFKVIAGQTGIPEAEVIHRFGRMMDAGIVRRIGAVPNHYALGYRANGMSVWDLPDSSVAALGRRVGALDFVSHCYQRPRHLPLWPYNLFAMVHGRSRAEVDTKVSEIAAILGEDCRAHDILYSTRILKKTGLRLAG